ncbi:unnamed protein product, partial [Meganyctiphanes norvegica]
RKCTKMNHQITVSPVQLYKKIILLTLTLLGVTYVHSESSFRLQRPLKRYRLEPHPLVRLANRYTAKSDQTSPLMPYTEVENRPGDTLDEQKFEFYVFDPTGGLHKQWFTLQKIQDILLQQGPLFQRESEYDETPAVDNPLPYTENVFVGQNFPHSRDPQDNVDDSTERLTLPYKTEVVVKQNFPHSRDPEYEEYEDYYDIPGEFSVPDPYEHD